MSETHIGPHPPGSFYRAGVEVDCQCARCGSSCEWQDCYNCEDGFSSHDCGDDCCCCLDPEPNVICDICHGHGGWQACMSSEEWCKAHPLPGREETPRGAIEWYTFEEPPCQS